MSSTAAQHLISEPGAGDARQYRQRVNRLAAEYLTLFVRGFEFRHTAEPA